MLLKELNAITAVAVRLEKYVFPNRLKIFIVSFVLGFYNNIFYMYV